MGMEGIYRRALYRVDGEQVFVLRVGQFSGALKALFVARECQSAAFLTAYNPGGVKVSDTHNNHAQSRLESTLKRTGFEVIAGIGLDSDSQSPWPGEPSVLVLGIEYNEAIEIARNFAQLALLWCPQSSIPELLMIQPEQQS